MITRETHAQWSVAVCVSTYLLGKPSVINCEMFLSFMKSNMAVIAGRVAFLVTSRRDQATTPPDVRRCNTATHAQWTVKKYSWGVSSLLVASLTCVRITKSSCSLFVNFQIFFLQYSNSYTITSVIKLDIRYWNISFLFPFPMVSLHILPAHYNMICGSLGWYYEQTWGIEVPVLMRNRKC